MVHAWAISDYAHTISDYVKCDGQMLNQSTYSFQAVEGQVRLIRWKEYTKTNQNIALSL